ncbi:Uncharacterised protein family (UPF0236) [Pseudobutyrivibrio sp. 49]|uniref:ISLre2 family transposase n=1 Tax=Pseudobutyrivibrio sp. 49 TaxID=1855344 RepID=UPI0008864BCB|nr:ISLre2 family transposase [Pseudobutyrivibrio sp. 49]SDI89070.1 Uncharacterised protein family (UPF0236) [Pseudobutyrivibrio sp. 49]
MQKSIQYFGEVCIQRFLEIQKELYQNPKDLAEFILNVESEVRKLGRIFIEETLEEMDQLIRESDKRKKHWVVETHDNKSLITSLGTINYTKTLFTSKDLKTEDGKEVMCYLLDKALGLTENQHLSVDAIAKVYEEATQTSYRRAGQSICSEDAISKEAVKELLHKTRFPKLEIPREKKKVKYLYIDADEDHYALQFKETKGDLVVNSMGRKNNGAINKIIYVYEGIEPEAPGSKRNCLIGTHYFCRGTEQDNKELWKEVFEYIENFYDTECLEKIYLNADGGSWIKEGLNHIAGVKYVLDEFHLSKYIFKMTSHMLDTSWDAQREIRKTIRQATKDDFNRLVERLLDYAKSESDVNRIKSSSDYILKNWSAAKIRLSRLENVVGSSTEGHVYHVLSSRMSTDPLGWSHHGASQMARFREYTYNSGNMLELARYQKEVLSKAAGTEELEISATKMVTANKRDRTFSDKEYGKYIECFHSALPKYLEDEINKNHDYYYVRSWF